MAINKQVQRARTRILLHHVFLSTLMLLTPFKEDESIPTACTDMKTITYNPSFFASLKDAEVVFVIVHELLHIVFMHGLRMRGRDPYMWNVACDYAINLILVKWGFEAPVDVLLDHAYEGMTAEQIYDKLMKEDAQEKQKLREKLGDSPTGSDLRDPAPLGGEDERRAVEDKAKQVISQAVSAARLAGSLPGEIERALGELLGGKVSWQQELSEFITEVSRSDEDWSRRNRRFSSVYLPGNYSLHMGRLVFIGDTSGSVTDDELNQAASEVAHISELVDPEAIHVLWADHVIKREEVLEQGEPIVLHPSGGGSTDMRVPLARAAELEPAVVVLVTDGYTPWPKEEPSYPLIVVCTTNAACPVGRVVRLSS